MATLYLGTLFEGFRMPIHQHEPASEMHQRDWIAIMAMQGLLASGKTGAETGKYELVNEVARLAYRIADAMLSEPDGRNS